MAKNTFAAGGNLQPLAKCSHSCLTLPLWKKLVSSSFKWVPKYILFLVKLKGQGKLFEMEKHRLTL